MPADRQRQLYCNRTLDLRGISAVGYDMDYTLVHYDVTAWEGRAYEFVREALLARGLPVADLRFDPGLAARGLIIDTQRGNVVKADRFGYVKRASHGTRRLTTEERRSIYASVIVDLRSSRWVFLNTLFSLSEACWTMQLVDLVEAGKLKATWPDIYRFVAEGMREAHTESRLKQEILADPGRYVVDDPGVARALADQRDAGKRVLLVTNSEHHYASPMLEYALGQHVPGGGRWSDLFDLAFFGARKPDFFGQSLPCFRVVSGDGLLREHAGPVRVGEQYVGGSASLVERSLGLAGEAFLYVGDHIFVDVNVAKRVTRWRTALILRELEEEIAAIDAFAEQQRAFTSLMREREALDQRFAAVRLRELRGESVVADTAAILAEIGRLDLKIAPLATAYDELVNPRWGLLLRAGRDKSHLARQVERYADVYTSRVSNLVATTPFAHLRGARGSLPHDDT
jgi:5'-nucleotidase